MRKREGRAEALAGTFNAQDVATTLWAACVFSLLRASNAEFRWVDTVVQRLVSLDKSACFNIAQLCQLHQFFLSCSVETRLFVEAIKDMQSLKDSCRLAFEGEQTAPSATQLQVSETLRHMGLSVEDEFRCPRSGYSIDMLVHDSALEIGGERSSRGGSWAVEFDGPSHFLASGAPTGATLLKRRHLARVGHNLVSVPYWEWDSCKGSSDRKKYLRGKLEARQGILTHSNRERVMPVHGMAQPQMMLMPPGQDGVSAAWQRGSINNQPPNAGMNNSEFAIFEGPSALPSLDPMIMQQWQTQQLMHMHSMIETLQEQNRTLNAEKSNTLKIAHPNMDMRELEQKKEMLHKDVLELLQQKTNLQLMCMQLHRFRPWVPL
jgi:hypothetical protein